MYVKKMYMYKKCMYYQVKWCQKTSEIFSAVPLEIQSLFHRGNQSLIHYIWCPFVGYLQIQRLEGRYDGSPPLDICCHVHIC